MYVIQLFVASTLYMIGIVIGFYLSGYTYKELTLQELEDELKKEQKMIEHMELIHFEHLYKDELEQLPIMDVNTERLKDKVLQLDVPMNQVIMFYDKDSFCYYTKYGDVIYKYLNVVCRKYVIDHNCRILYKEGMEPIAQEPILDMDECFTKKKPKPIRESKRINPLVRLGTIEDYYDSKKIVPKNNISFMDYVSNK
jgi:hypothetical protein